MRKEDTATLNQHALAERLRLLGLKQYWVADRLGVTKLTVNRWLTGRVRRISRDNLSLLAKVLQCEQEALVYSDELDVHATQQEQKEAARMLVSRSSIELFMASGKQDIYEKLAKAVIHPNLPLHNLMQIYATLTTSAYEQGKLEQTKEYSQLYLDYAVRCGDSKEELAARSSLAATDGAMGKLAEAIDALNDLLSAAESVGNTAGCGGAMCNLTHAYRLKGEVGKALKVLSLLNSYTSERPRSKIAGAAANVASGLALELGFYELAIQRQHLFLELAGSLVTPQERIAGRLLALLAHCLAGSPVDDWECYRCIGEFTLLPIRPELSITWPAVLMRRTGNPEGGQTYLLEAVEYGRLRVYDPPFVKEELARCACALGDDARARDLLTAANKEYEGFGMHKRVHDDPQAEIGQILRPPARAKAILSGAP